MLVCVLIAHIFLEYTKHGRFIYAMGGNKQAAKLSGINVKAYRYLAGMITAVFVAIGGILVASRGSSAQVMCCDNYLMQSLAAVFVGRSVGGAERPNALGHPDRRDDGFHAGKRPDHLRGTVLCAARRQGRGARAGAGCSLRHQEGTVMDGLEPLSPVRDDPAAVSNRTDTGPEREVKPGLVLFHLCRKPQIASATENPVTIPVTIYSGGMPA